jgi:lysophospholipase L1-like esterase/dienelactone hydrolase
MTDGRMTDDRRRNMKMRIFVCCFLFIGATSWAQKIKVACVGNSITVGAGITDSKHNSYPAQLQSLLGNDYEVSNFGVSGTTLLKKGNSPYWQTPKYQQALQSNPAIVLIKLGTNDSKLVNRVYLDEFKSDLHELVQSFVQLPSHPRVVLLLPVMAFGTDTSSIYDPVIVKKIIPLITQVAYADSLEVIDLHSLFADKQELVPDKIHPNKEGAAIIANRLYQLVMQKRDTVFNVFNKITFPQKISSFNGYRCADFTFNGRSCKVVQPKWAASNHPWVWRARFWGHEPQADIALLERGFHIVYCDVAELYGNKEAVALWNGFYKLLRKAGLAKKVALEGMSRGGVYVYNWAAENRKKVACVYVDNPVLDLKSWPGGKGKGPGSKGDWDKVITDYQLNTEAAIAGFAGSPIDKVKQIVKGKYPMLHVCGDADEVVPMEENTIPFEQKVKALKGDITVIHKPGFKHHPHSLPNPTPIVEFIVKHSLTN